MDEKQVRAIIEAIALANGHPDADGWVDAVMEKYTVLINPNPGKQSETK
jgi:hypothetical protein